jgi:hypothetical protein
MWFIIPVPIIALLEWVSGMHDPSTCKDLMKQSMQWDGEVAEAIRFKARANVKQSISDATFGLMDTTRGGECELRFGDIQIILLGFVILGLIKTFRTHCKCVAFSSRFCPKHQNDHSVPAEPEPKEEPQPKERVKTPTSDSHLRFRRLNKEVPITRQPPLPNFPPLVKTTSTPQMIPV